ncbi:peptidase domain-containing ABC transporter [Bacteroides acidifaciens]|uniref:peptidase domain-containing ABC transporter n=1 Tax=Bacteroides acidifaciens TaxID=85831 RepID=UPI003014BB04
MGFKLTRQFDQMDCGPACIRMVANHYGKKYPLSYLRSVSCLSREGVSIAGIRFALTDIGIHSASYEVTLEQLRQCPLPAILHWEQNHFVVLYKIRWSRLKKEWQYYVANPAYGKHTFTEKDFKSYWQNGEKGVAIALKPTETFYRKGTVKEKHSLLRFGKKYVWPFRREMGQLAFGLLSGILLSLVAPFMTQAMVDNGIGMKDMGVIKSLLMAQVALFIGTFSMGLISSWVTLYIGTRININILQDYLTKLLHLPMTFFETKSIGDYQQRLGDHARLQGFTTQGTMQTAFSLLSCSVLLIIIGYYSILILVAYLFLTGLSTLWMTYFFRKRKSLDYEQFRLSSQNQNKLYELLNGIADIKLNCYEDYKIKEWQGMQEKLYAMSRKTLRLGQIQSTGYTLIGQVRNIIITFWIAVEVTNGNLTFGMMMSISSIIGQVNGPLSQLIGFLQQFQDAKISLERSEEVHLCKNEDEDELKEMPVNGPKDINLVDVGYSYTGNIGKSALQDISFCIPAGKMTAIVGESGSGKTTLMKLLLKFDKPTTGHILLDGKELSIYKAASIRKHSGIVMQDSFIFSDTIRRNIIMGEEESEEKLEQAIEAACLADYIADLPLGTHTKIGTEGNGISGGERQRIMIARAIYKNPDYLIMDEATSSLDAENERKITENLNRIFKGRTLIVIAHRLSTVRDADQIVFLKHGRLEEIGTHEELIEKRGGYFNLVKNQLELAK